MVLNGYLARRAMLPPVFEPPPELLQPVALIPTAACSSVRYQLRSRPDVLAALRRQSYPPPVPTVDFF